MEGRKILVLLLLFLSVTRIQHQMSLVYNIKRH